MKLGKTVVLVEPILQRTGAPEDHVLLNCAENDVTSSVGPISKIPKDYQISLFTSLALMESKTISKS